ncbi:MAG: thrombospondin type 3 repeat-containing protein [Candidatus Paceibacterota bacterium]|jgi:hypothetical protein
MNLKNIYNKYQKYLPSKKFAYLLVGVVVIFFLVIFVKINKKGEEAGNNSATALKIENQTINDLIAKDSDGDGISDWEETLWGTDKNNIKTFDNIPDVTYIENKKKELNIEQSVNINKLTETDKFAREFFSSFSAMKTSGDVDQNTINSFSNALGQKIVNPELEDVYTPENVKVNMNQNANEIEQKIIYYENVKKLFEAYESTGIGDELDIINTGLATSTTTNAKAYSRLPIIADAYKNFAKKLMALSVPSDFITYHLDIANGAYNTGISVSNMKEIISDPLVGLEGLAQYQKYSENLVKGVGDLEDALIQ